MDNDLNENNNKDKRNIKNNLFEQSEIFSDQADDLENYPRENSKPIDDPEEYQHLTAICAAFLNYQIDSLKDVARMERDFSSLSVTQLKLLKYDYKDRIKKSREAIWSNYSFLLKIVSPYSHMFKFFKNENNEILMESLRVAPKDVVKMRSTLKLFIRDWAKEVELFNYFKIFREKQKEIYAIKQSWKIL